MDARNPAISWEDVYPLYPLIERLVDLGGLRVQPGGPHLLVGGAAHPSTGVDQTVAAAGVRGVFESTMGRCELAAAFAAEAALDGHATTLFSARDATDCALDVLAS